MARYLKWKAGGVLQGVIQNQSGRGVAKADVTLTERRSGRREVLQVFDMGIDPSR